MGRDFHQTVWNDQLRADWLAILRLAVREDLGQAEMSRDEICIRVDLNLAAESARIWTSDLSYEYVKINAEYRS